MLAYQERVIAEEAELSEKIRKLGEFINSKGFETVTTRDQDDLHEQGHAMEHYATILRRRIANFRRAGRIAANEQG